MADNVANILMRLGGEDDGASDTLEAFLAKLKAFGKTEATAEADVSVGAGASKLSALEAALTKFARQRATAKADVEVETSGLENLSKSLKESALAADLTEQQLARLNKQKELADRRSKLVLPVGVQTTEARKDMARALAEFTSSVESTRPELHLAAEGALKELAEVQAAIKAFGAASQDLRVESQVDVDTAPAATKLALLAAQLRKFDASRAIAEAEIRPTISNLSNIFSDLTREAERKKIVVQAGIETGEMVSELDRALAVLNGMVQARHPTVKPKVDTAEALSELAAWTAAVEAADRQDINVDIDVNKVSMASQLMMKLASVMASGVSGAQRMGGAIGGITVNLGPFGVKLTAITGIVLALAFAMGVSLVAALGLLVTSLAAATAAVGALAAAFVGALGPIVGIAIATVGRITKIVQALKAKTQAEKDSAKGSAASIAAEEKRRDALAAVGRAVRGVTSAERGLQQAQEAARDGITQANREVVSSQQAAGNASRAVAREMVEAYKAIEQAAEDARDAILDVEAAEIGMDRSKIATQKAELALREFRGEAGLAGKEFDRLFDKFTDVAVDFDVSALQGIVPGGATTATGEDPAIKGAELVLDLRDAKLGEKQATDRLSDSKKTLAEARQLEAKYARDGIAAYEPLTMAIQAQEQATIQLSAATERANEVNAAGIDNAPGVLAASETLLNAQETLTNARRESAKAAKGAAGGAEAQKAKEDWDALTAAEKLFALALQETGRALRTTFQPAVEGVLGGIATAFTQIPAILAPLTDSFTALGKAMGESIAGFAEQLRDPQMSAAFVKIIDGATQLVKILGGKAWQSFFEIMTNLAASAMPLLVATSTLFANALERIAGKTRDPKKLGNAMASLGEHLYGILGLVKQVGRIFLAFFGATSGQAKGFVATLTGMAKGLADFLSSAEGQQQIQDFFKAVIPLAVETIKFIGNAILFILQLVETVAPALTGLLRAFNLFFGVLNRVLGIFKPFLKIAAQIALLFLGGLPLAIGKFLSKFRLLAPIASFLTRNIVGVVTKIIGRVSAIASAFPVAFEKVKTFILGFIGFLGDRFKEVVNVITWPFKQAIKFITDLGGRFFEAGKGIIEAIINGMKSLIDGIGGIAGKVFKFLVDKLPGSEPKDKTSPLAGLGDRGRAIVENIAAGVNANADLLTRSLHSALVPVVAGIDANVSVPRTAGTGTAPPTSPGPRTLIEKVEMPINAPAGHLPDAEATAMAIAQRIENRFGGMPGQEI